MKNVNLSGIFLALVAKFGINSFELKSIVPEGRSPIDALIVFELGKVKEEDLPSIKEMIDGYVTGEVTQIAVAIKPYGADMVEKLEVYLEFKSLMFIDDLS